MRDLCLHLPNPAMYVCPSRIENFDPAESGGSTYLTGDYHGYFNSEMITVIAPVTENFSTHGYLLVHKPYSQITDVHSVLMRNTYIVILIIYVLSFIILLGVHFLIYRPLVKITNRQSSMLPAIWMLSSRLIRRMR